SPEDAYNLIKNNDADTISNICNLLLKGKGIEEIFKEMNSNSFSGKALVVKRIMGTNDSNNEKGKPFKKEDQIVFKGEDLDLLKKLISIAIQSGKLQSRVEDSDKFGMMQF